MTPKSKAKGGRKNKSPNAKNFAGKKRQATNTSTPKNQPAKKKRVSFGPTVSTENAGAEKSQAKPILKKRNEETNESSFETNGFTNEEQSSFSTTNSETPRQIRSASSSFRASSKTNDKTLAMTRKDKIIYLRQLKAKKRPNYELSKKAKDIWEKLRNCKADSATKTKLTEELFALVEGKAKELIYAHDTVRVFQCLMALKNEDVRTKLFEELKDEVLNMSKKKYAKYFVIKMLKYGTPSQRMAVMKSFFGHVPDLVKHTIASDVVEYAYNEYANALQRCHLASEFYGSEYQVFKTEEVVNLKAILSKEPKKKDMIIQTLYDHLLVVAEKPVMKHSLVHRLLLEFFENCSDEKRNNLVDSIKDRTIEMVHTRDGTLASMYCLWYGSVKDRKAIVKSLKGLVTKICMEEHGHLFLLALFDSVDDTVLVGKIVLQEIKKNLKEILANKYGMKVIEYLLSPRNSKYFGKQIVDVLAVGDVVTESKKSREAKYSELLALISPDVLAYATENIRQMIFDPHSCLVLSFILDKTDGDKRPAFEAVCEVLRDEFIPCNSESLHLIEHAHGHFVLKQMLKHDKQLHQLGKLTLCEVIIDELPANHFASWLTCNKGAFVLVHMLESGVPKVKETVIQVVEKSKKKLKKYTFSSAKLLLKKLNE